MSNPRSALVTGGAGFIGSEIVRRLLSQGHRVRVLDNLSGPKSWQRLEGVLFRIDAIEGDIRDINAVRRAVAGVDTIFHEAALVSVPESVKYPAEYHAVNATATLQLLESAVHAGVRRFIYASTSAIYGDAPQQPKVESMRAMPISPYAIAKYVGELYVSAFASLFGLETISLRYFNVFGAGQDLKSQYGAAVPSIVSKILAGQRPTIYGDGEQTRDFCHVTNVVHANMLAFEAKQLSGDVVNIGCGVRVSINRIANLAGEFLGKSVHAVYEPSREGDVRDSLADTEAAKKLLGYEPRVNFDEGLRELIEWHRTSRKTTAG